MFRKIVEILTDIGPTYILLASCLITIMFSCMARAGMWDAFFFQKSKRQKKADRKSLSIWQKIALPYSALRSTNAPRHMRLFWWYRIINGVFLVSACVFVWLAEHICATIAPYVIGYMLLKALIFDIPFLIYSLFCGGDPDNPKGWNFHLFKRP